MPTSLNCPACSARLLIKDESLLGKPLACPKCKHRFLAPQPKAQASESVLIAELTDRPPEKPKKAASPEMSPLPNLPHPKVEPKPTQTSTQSVDLGQFDFSNVEHGTPVGVPGDLTQSPASRKSTSSPWSAPVVAAKPRHRLDAEIAPAPAWLVLKVAGGSIGGVLLVLLLIYSVHKIWSAVSVADAQPRQASEALSEELHEIARDIVDEGRFESLIKEIESLDPNFLMTTVAEERSLLSNRAIRETTPINEAQAVCIRQMGITSQFSLFNFVENNAMDAELRIRLLGTELRHHLINASKPLSPKVLQSFKHAEKLAYGENSIFNDLPSSPPSAEIGLQLELPRLQKVAGGLMSFVNDYKAFPTAFGLATAKDKNLSWRVSILPYIGYRELYSKFDLTQPWDSPSNRALLGEMPVEFASASVSKKGFTSLHLVRGEKGLSDASSSVGLSSLSDPRQSTLLCIAAGAKTAVEWTKPSLLEFDAARDGDQFGSMPQGILPVVMADGSIKLLSSKIDSKMLLTLIDRQDGKPEIEEIEEFVIAPSATTDRLTLARYKLKAMLPKGFNVNDSSSNGSSPASEPKEPMAKSPGESVPSNEPTSPDKAVLQTVLGFDVKQRTRLVDYLQRQGMNRPKANIRMAMVVSALKNTAKEYDVKVDANGEMPLPEKLLAMREAFDEGTIAKPLLTSSKIPNDFSKLIADYQNEDAHQSKEERELAFFVLLAFVATEM